MSVKHEIGHAHFDKMHWIVLNEIGSKQEVDLGEGTTKRGALWKARSALRKLLAEVEKSYAAEPET